MYKAIRVKSWNLQPEIVEIKLETYLDEENREWIKPIPGVTGYESAQLKEIIKDYVNDKPVFSRWIACAGTLNKYDRLEVPMSEIIRYLEDMKRITVKKDYGYIKTIHWNDSSEQTIMEEAE